MVVHVSAATFNAPHVMVQQQLNVLLVKVVIFFLLLPLVVLAILHVRNVLQQITDIVLNVKQDFNLCHIKIIQGILDTV